MWKPYLFLCISDFLCSKWARDWWYGQGHRSQTCCNNAVLSLCRHAGHHKWFCIMNSRAHKLQLAWLQTLSVVHLPVKMYVFCNITQCEPCNQHAYKPCKACNRHACKPYSCSLACNNAGFLQHYSMETLQHACLQTLQLFSCTQKCMLSAKALNANLVRDMPTNPISCSLACKHTRFL